MQNDFLSNVGRTRVCASDRTSFDNELKKPPFIKEVARRLRRDGGFIR